MPVISKYGSHTLIIRKGGDMNLGGRKRAGEGNNIAEVDERDEKTRKGNSNASNQQRRTVRIEANDTKILRNSFRHCTIN